LLLPVSVSYGLFGSKASNRAVLASMVLSFAVSFGWMIYGIRNENPYLEVRWGEQNLSLGTLIPGLFVSALVLGAGEIVGRRRHDGR
jgi:Na+/proline symporter